MPIQLFTRSLVLGVVLTLTACGGCGDPGEDDIDENGGEPILCYTHDDCEDEDHRCILEEPGEQGQCLTLFEMRSAGESCSQSRHCESGLCYEEVCTIPCEASADCPGNEVCSDIGICEPPVACASDDDCGETKTCAVGLDGDGELATICLDHNGGAAAGESCSIHDDCGSRYCSGGVCTAPCEEADHCGVLQQCGSEAINKHGQDGTFDLCVEMEPIECMAPSDCELDELTCNTVVPETGTVEGAVCGPTNPDEAALGAMCTESAACESDYCWTTADGSAGECTVFCQDSGDDCAADQHSTSKTAGLGLCLAGCDTTADCDGDNVCQLGNGPQTDEVHTYCSLQHGTGQTGEACSTSSDCATGLCLEIVTYTVTEDSCNADAQCDNGYECRCAPGDDGCAQADQVCVSEEGAVQDLCSELCTADADCEGGDHEMTSCNPDVQITFGGQEADLAACSLEREG